MRNITKVLIDLVYFQYFSHNMRMKKQFYRYFYYSGYIYLNVISLNIKIYMDNFECKWQYLKLKKTYVTMQIKSFFAHWHDSSPFLYERGE